MSRGAYTRVVVFPYHANAGQSLLIPADTARFVYDDVTGEMRQANKRHARLHRTYYPGGALRTDTPVFGVYASPLTDGTTRGQSCAYDLSGRRTSMVWYDGTYTYAITISPPSICSSAHTPSSTG